MLYRLFIATEAGEQRLDNVTARNTEVLLSTIKGNAQVDDVIQVVIYDLLAPEQDGIQPVVTVGSFASYYNGRAREDLMENFNANGRGLDLHNELNRLAKEQTQQQWSA